MKKRTILNLLLILFVLSFFVYRWQVIQSRKHLVKEYRRLKRAAMQNADA